MYHWKRLLRDAFLRVRVRKHTCLLYTFLRQWANGDPETRSRSQVTRPTLQADSGHGRLAGGWGPPVEKKRGTELSLCIHTPTCCGTRALQSSRPPSDTEPLLEGEPVPLAALLSCTDGLEFPSTQPQKAQVLQEGRPLLQVPSHAGPGDLQEKMLAWVLPQRTVWTPMALGSVVKKPQRNFCTSQNGDPERQSHWAKVTQILKSGI